MPFSIWQSINFFKNYCCSLLILAMIFSSAANIDENCFPYFCLLLDHLCQLFHSTSTDRFTLSTTSTVFMLLKKISNEPGDS